MDENLEKKPKRPRISEVKPAIEDNESPRYERMTDYSRETQDNQSRQGGYQPRYSRQGGYYNQSREGYQPRGNYQPRYQQNRYGQQAAGNNPAAADDAAGNTAEGAAQQPQQGGYQPRQGYNRQGGYQPRQGGYNRQGGYRPRPQGGYQQRQGGYNRQPGGYQQRQGGYNRPQGGYQQRPGGYQQRPGGYNRQQPKKRMPQGPRPQMRFTPRPQPVEYEQPIIDPNTQIRLNKFMANAGVCSRREADELIQKGLIKVNGEVVTELGVKITPKDTVEYNGKEVMSERKVYILLNKPKDTVTTSDDPNGRKTVMDLVKGACEERIYPVGRLDRNTTGVLLLTNDGDLASKLTHPKYVKKKIYQVWTDKPISEEDMQHIADGVDLDDGPIHADAVSYVSPTDRKQAGIEIHSGRNRVVRRIFESLGYHVVKLDRVYFAGLTKKNLPRGRWRYLTQEEVNFLKQGSFE